MYNINQVNKALKMYVEAEVIPSLPPIMKVLLGTYVDSMQLTQDQLNQLISSPMIKPLGIEQNGLYDLDKLLDNLETNVTKYGPMEFVLSKIGPFPLNDLKIFKFNADDVNKLKDYLKQQQ